MLNDNLKSLRKSKGLTQQEFATKLNVVRQTVSKWETGLSVPDSEMLVQISNVFEISVATLLGENSNFLESQDEMKMLAEKLSVINETQAKKSERKRKFIRVISCMGLLFCLILIISQIIEKIYHNSIGYIGGIDTPTSIILIPSNNNGLIILTFIVVLFLSLFGIYFTRKNK